MAVGLKEADLLEQPVVRKCFAGALPIKIAVGCRLLDFASLPISDNFSGTEDSSPCDVYQLTVTAKNAAGWSDPSDFFTASLPSGT